jgi:hypothetical protein
MNREAFWTGFYIWFVFQFMMILVGRFIEDWSWWIVLIPTLLVVLGGTSFAIYFWFTCDPRIEKDKSDVDNAD